MTLPAVQEEWNLSALGLKLSDPELPYERFEVICATLGHAHAAIKFAVGDAILYGEELYGERAYQAFELLNLSEESMRECARVSARVPMSRRRKGVSWSHHRAVAALPPPEQKEWLGRIKEQGLSHHALRDALRNGRPPKQSLVCRCCGKSLDV